MENLILFFIYLNKNLENFRKEQETKYLNDLTNFKTKIADFINNNVNIAIKEAVKQVYAVANNELKEAVSNSGHAKTQENEAGKDETQDSTIEDDEEFTRPE